MHQTVAPAAPANMVSTGIPGLDAVLHGGLQQGRAYLISGAPGAGKTTMALQFLLAAAARGEKALYLTLSQSSAELHHIAKSHGWSLDGVEIIDLSSERAGIEAATAQSVLLTSEVELTGTMAKIAEAVRASKTSCLAFDSLAEVSLLADDNLRFRREVFRLKALVGELGITAMFIGGVFDPIEDDRLAALLHGVLHLDATVPAFGISQHRLLPAKMRGQRIVRGWHDFDIRTGGLVVYPRILDIGDGNRPTYGRMPSGIDELDKVVGGGLETGTACMIIGQSGTGKSTLATTFARTAALNRTKAAVLLFEERPEAFRTRSRGINLDLSEVETSGMLQLVHFQPAETVIGAFMDGDHSRGAMEQGGEVE